MILRGSPQVNMMNDQNMARLRELLLSEFNEDELDALCQHIGLNYAELPGVGAYGKSRELIEAARARHAIRPLMARVRELRPDAYKASRIVGGEAEPAGAKAPETAQRLARPAAPAAVPTEPARAAPAPAPSSGTASILPPRVRLAAILIAVLLLAVVALSLALPKPAAAPAQATAAQTNALTASQPTAVAANNAATATVANATVAATPAPTATQQIAVTATKAPSKTRTPSPSPTPTISQTHPAAQAVHVINDQLVAFYTGKASAEELKRYWRGDAYQTVITFAYSVLKRQLGIDLTKKQPFDVTMRYVRPPTLVSQSGNTARVQAREYWRYTNPATRRTVCETRNYNYTLLKEGDTYRVYQVGAFRGDLVDTNCQDSVPDTE